MESVDALITNETGVTLVTYYADCTPLFFVDTKNRAVGLAHAGWRGTAGRIGEKVVKKMTGLYGTAPGDIVAAIGPAISVCCYEVDKPCAENFYALEDLKTDKFIFPKQGGKYMIDLLEANRQILVAAGVKEQNITVSDLCTNCNSELLWSHRATKGRRGTMCALLCLLDESLH
jgi:YfiH family protein